MIPALIGMASPGLFICRTVSSTCQTVGGWVAWLMWFLLTVKFHDARTLWSDIGLEMRVTLNIVSTSRRNRTQPLKIAAVRIWTHLLHTFEQENSVIWPAS